MSLSLPVLYVCLAGLDYSMTYVGSQVVCEWMSLLTAAFLILRMRKAAVNKLILDFFPPFLSNLSFNSVSFLQDKT